jgi:REP element-mobilizing transposase RayT
MSTERFNNQYRVESTRLQNWDYRWDGYYFITICTKDKIEYFGEIQNGEMVLSSLGIIADVLWHEIKNHAQNIKLDAFIVMPNHIHGIIILSGNSLYTLIKAKTPPTPPQP